MLLFQKIFMDYKNSGEKMGRLNGKKCDYNRSIQWNRSYLRTSFRAWRSQSCFGRCQWSQPSTVEEEIKGFGVKVFIHKTDVSSENEIKALINLALEKFINVDILVNNAGISGGLDALEIRNPRNGTRFSMSTLWVLFYATKHIIAHMKARRCGSIIKYRFGCRHPFRRRG